MCRGILVSCFLWRIRFLRQNDKQKSGRASGELDGAATCFWPGVDSRLPFLNVRSGLGPRRNTIGQSKDMFRRNLAEFLPIGTNVACSRALSCGKTASVAC